MAWITIKSYTLAHEAHLDEMLLQSEGIETFLKDELTNRVDNFLSHAIGGVKLQVQKHDAYKAREILDIPHSVDPAKDYKPIADFAETIAAYIPFVRKWGYQKKIVFSLTLLALGIGLFCIILYGIFA